MERRFAVLIKHKCGSILSLPLLKEVRDGKFNGALKVLADENIHIDDIRKHLVNLLDIVKICVNEVDYLDDALVTKNFEKCEFFGRVWSGDAYGVAGEQGLKDVVKEIDECMNVVGSPERFCKYILDKY